MTDLPSTRGRLITLEGGEGAGKSTQVRRLIARLQAAGIAAVATREPGGSPNAEVLRDLILSGTFKSLGPKAEAILFSAARIDHLDTLIAPALAAGTWVVCDRFSDSTRVYQGVSGGLDASFIGLLERVTLGEVRPDLTLILDLPPETGLERAANRRPADEKPDRFEAEDSDFHGRLRDGYLALAAQEPGRCMIVDATLPEEEVAEAIWDTIAFRFSIGQPAQA